MKIKKNKVEIVQLDLSSFKSIEECVKKLDEEKVVIDILINNAGVMVPPFTKTKEGLELQMGTNHIGHFYFTILLFDHGRMVQEGARVINVSSRAHRRGGDINVDNLFMNENNYQRMKAYAHSKMANILFSIELQRRMNLLSFNMDTCSLHPGAVNTELSRYITSSTSGKILKIILYPIVYLVFKSPLQGAQTTICCALDPHLSQASYFADCEVTDIKHFPPNHEEVAKNLWIKSEEICGYKSKFFE